MTEPEGPDRRSKPNRLISASSPYLRQHAYNPVDWFPWGEEAFERARAEDRPIFLSIGYATCHWCHVMAHESFEDESVAALLNDGFVSIKLDREERPDVDAVYMTVCQLMTGQGGWPLTIAMTPDRRPFFAGTYFPREGRHGRIGMLELIPRLLGLWEERRADLEASADSAVAALEEMEARFEAGKASALDRNVLERGSGELARRFDPNQGGFGRAPKFPTPHNLLFLLRWHDRTGDSGALEMVETTLTMMRRGGIFDHVGFGFHRYSTDSRWLVPHFEKMLYDQALLVMAYAEAWHVTRDDRYRRTADEILEYVARDLTDEHGGFYSAEDADSEGREGAFYVWTRSDFEEALSDLDPADVAFATETFRVASRGNFAEEATGRMTGENILHRAGPLPVSGSEEDRRAAADRLERIRRALYRHRDERPRPLLDDKILTDWNGLMIAAFALAGRTFESPQHIERARRAAEFVLREMVGSEGLRHRYRAGEAGIPAGAADYACLAWGLLELYAATYDARWLEKALELARALIEGFWDDARGGVFSTTVGVEDVIVRQREIYDGATPSANSTAWYVFLRLARLTGDPEWESRAEGIAAAFADAVGQNPAAHAMSLVAIDLAVGPSREVVVAGPRGREDTAGLLAAVGASFRPRTTVLLRGSDAGEEDPLDRLAPFTRGQGPVDGRAAAYVCTDFACQRPTTDASAMVTLLD